MAGSFRPSATFFDISERSLEQPRKAIAPDAGQNLRVRRHEMDTWRTTNANHGVLLSRATERARNKTCARQPFRHIRHSKSSCIVCNGVWFTSSTILGTAASRYPYCDATIRVGCKPQSHYLMR
jgi:hypothetical protein